MSTEEFGPERSKPWSIYTANSDTSSPPSSETVQEAPWKSFGTSMNAISFGLVATAILISMFLIMAIFEHLFRPSDSPEAMTSGGASLESGPKNKLGNTQTVSTPYASDFSVLMPGQQYPTYIAQPAPLPCRREGTYWPSHQHNFVHP